MKCLVLGSLLFICVLSPLSRCEDSKDDAKAMQGTWLPTAAELGGNKLPDENLKALKLVLKDGKYTVTAGGETDQGTVKLDVASRPKSMDITGTDGPNKGKTFPAIYELSGDTLKVCYDLSGKTRPAKFETKPDTMQLLITYKRDKP
jgi:uncharacterized protein (TIGR03067 family)